MRASAPPSSILGPEHDARLTDPAFRARAAPSSITDHDGPSLRSPVSASQCATGFAGLAAAVARGSCERFVAGGAWARVPAGTTHGTGSRNAALLSA